MDTNERELECRGRASLFWKPSTLRSVLIGSLRNSAPGHLFFYGRPGTGKTELAKALSVEAGRQAFLVKYKDDGDERDRRRAITATLSVAPSDAGGIASALKAAENIFTDQTPQAVEVEKTLGQLLTHHEKLSGVDQNKEKAQPPQSEL